MERGNLRTGTATSSDKAFMGKGRSDEGPKTPQAIADHLAAGVRWAAQA